MNIEAIAQALGGAHRIGASWMARCPVHKGGKERTPSLKLDAGNGCVLVRCHADCGQLEVIAALKERGLWSDNDIPLPTPRTLFRPGNHNGERARSLWQDALLIAGTLGETYLRSRGITIALPPTLRFIERLNHTEAGAAYPVLLAAVAKWPDKHVCAVQRTYLRKDGLGKAPVMPAKKSLGSTTGAAVRLAAVGEKLGLTEGIEDALSVMQADPTLPCWAVLGAEGFKSVVLPPSVRELVLLADADPVGVRAVNEAAVRFRAEGRDVRIATPPTGCKDFNEALLSDALGTTTQHTGASHGR